MKKLNAVIALTVAITSFASGSFANDNPFISSSEAENNLERRLAMMERRAQETEMRLEEILMNTSMPSVSAEVIGQDADEVSTKPERDYAKLEVVGDLNGECIARITDFNQRTYMSVVAEDECTDYEDTGFAIAALEAIGSVTTQDPE